MPDTLSLSTGVSLGLLAGIVSGVCYLMANGINWPRYVFFSIFLLLSIDMVNNCQ
ncbi:hypothetical protein RR48_03156 [Papilio machaon]|uniref:Uncharacterized protein n=1 Tax=Papilio machaon TaxID=76193 RepID=A0A0N1I8H6_PAPMA|nr:hypothetical protein RR48_03156 [Papilio machaon]